MSEGVELAVGLNHAVDGSVAGEGQVGRVQGARVGHQEHRDLGLHHLVGGEDSFGYIECVENYY